MISSRRCRAVSFVALTAVAGLVGCGGDEPVAKAEPAPKPVAKPVAPPPPAAPVVPPDPTAGLPKTPATFAEAKLKAEAVYSEEPKTLFCGCQYGSDRVVRSTCGYQVRADEELARKLVWEHIVPLRSFGAERACWKTPVCKDESGKAFRGVRCCEQTDPVFRTMQNDLHNLAPVAGELANDRSGFEFGEIERERRMYGLCDFEVDTEAGVAEPRDEVRGDVARAYLYMRETYKDAVSVTPEQLETYKAWHEADPPSPEEVARNAKIAEIQGTANPFIPLAG